MLSVFGDESADETKQRVFAVAGVVGTEELWRPLEEYWLERTGGIPFHAKDCESDHGDYRDKPHAENQALYKDLAIAISKSGIGGWGLAIDLAAQRRVFPESPDLAFYKGFTEVIEHMRNVADFNRQTAEFTFDSSDADHNAGCLYTLFRSIPQWTAFIGPKVSFAAATDCPSLQVADLFVREAMKALDNKVGPKVRPMRKSWQALYETERFHVEALTDPWFESLKTQLPAMEQRTGASQVKYQEWLKNNRLQHCTTNLFRFLDYLDKEDKRENNAKRTK